MIAANENLRNIFKSSDYIPSRHKILAEWNMNKYQEIVNIGIYKTPDSNYATSYDENNTEKKYVDGNPLFIYDDDTTKISDRNQYLSSLASVFEADRPDPGIVLLQSVQGALIAANARVLRVSKMRESNARFYPISTNRSYEYFNSGRFMDVSEQTGPISGVCDISGNINYANPFVVYDEPFPCNKIVIKVQKHVTYPITFTIDVMLDQSTTWTPIYTKTDDDTEFESGILEIYYSNNSWSTTEANITDINEISQPDTQAVKIKGIRLRVKKLKPVNAIAGTGPGGNPSIERYKGSLELIEISPRVQADLSDYTSNFSYNSSLGDSEFGLPIGRLVASNGTLSLSNETKNFLLSGEIAQYNMMTPDVEFRFYQIVNDGTNDNTIPLKTMYSDSWNINNDFSAQVDLSDRIKLFQDKNVMDMAMLSKNGIPLSAIILMLLDNLGITGFEFKKSSRSDENNDTEDVKIKSFFCNKEKTLTQVLEELAVATQTAMFIDANNRLNILTKERVAEKSTKEEALTQFTGSTNFWMVYDEKYAGEQEESYISSYKSNVIDSSETRIDPVTDGTIVFHSYGVAKQPGASLIEKVMKDAIPDELIEDVPANSIVTSDYDYITRVLWKPAEDNEAVLGAANLQNKLSSTRVKTAFNDLTTEQKTALNEEAMIRKLCNRAYNDANQGNNTKIESLIIRLDRNDAFMFPDYSGFVLIDNEFIKYTGIIYFISGDATSSATIRPYYEVLFSREEFNEKINALTPSVNIAVGGQAPPKPSILPVGLVVDVTFKVEGSAGDREKVYNIVSDGRGSFNSRISAHEPYNQNTVWSPDSNKFNIVIGNPTNRNIGQLTSTTQYEFDKTFKKLKIDSGLPKPNLVTRLGYLKISGPKGSESERRRIDSSLTASTASVLDALNKEVDESVPGTGSASFDPYVYLPGERFLYGHKVDLDFAPNAIGTKMRLFSGRRKKENQEYVSSTNSSIAGIGFGIKTGRDKNNKLIVKSGYFLEVESIGHFRNIAGEDSNEQNLRLYKISINKDGKMIPKVLATGRGKAFTVVNSDTSLLKSEYSNGDPTFDLEIRVDNSKKKQAKIDVFYANQKINSKPIIEKVDNDNGFWDGCKNICVFVRNDSQAMYEYLYASSKPIGKTSSDAYFDIQDIFFEDELEQYSTGKFGISAQRLFKNDEVQLYFEDFAKLVRQTKVYEPRFQAPSITQKLIDVSAINPQYMIKSEKYSAYGARIVVVNTSTGAIALSSNTNLPLYIYGTQMEELTSGEVTMEKFYEKINSPSETTQLEINRSLYGKKTFTIDSIFMQNRQQAERMMRWLIENCSRQRMSISLETIANPLIELGDKVKIFSKDRDYVESNANFGRKTFVVTEINYNVGNDGPRMNIVLIEVGA